MKVILYARTSTDEQANGIEDQVARLSAEAESRGWPTEVLVEHASGKTLAHRPVLQEALSALDSATEGVLVVTKLDRLTRSVADFEAILRRSERGGWNVIILDMGGHMLDTSTAMGKMHVQMLAVFAEFERASISERTRAGLAVVKANGKQLGRPTTISDAARGRILELRDAGLSWQAIADRLDADGVPGANGGRWTPITVRRQHKRALDLRPVQ